MNRGEKAGHRKFLPAKNSTNSVVLKIYSPQLILLKTALSNKDQLIPAHALQGKSDAN